MESNVVVIPTREDWLGALPPMARLEIIQLSPVPLFDSGFAFRGEKTSVTVLGSEILALTSGHTVAYTCRVGNQTHKVALPALLKYVRFETLQTRDIARVLVKAHAHGSGPVHVRFVVRTRLGHIWCVQDKSEATYNRFSDAFGWNVTRHVQAGIARIVAHYLGLPVIEYVDRNASCPTCTMFRKFRGADPDTGDEDAQRPSLGTGNSREQGPWDESFWYCALGQPLEGIEMVVRKANEITRSGMPVSLKLDRCGENCPYWVSQEAVANPREDDDRRWVRAHHAPPPLKTPTGWRVLAGWDIRLNLGVPLFQGGGLACLTP